MNLKAQVKLCLSEYQKTLDHYGIRRKVTSYDEIAICRAIARYDVNFVRLAILGASMERPSENFNPADFVSLARILDPKKIERFANLGAGARQEDQAETTPIQIQLPEEK